MLIDEICLLDASIILYNQNKYNTILKQFNNYVLFNDKENIIKLFENTNDKNLIIIFAKIIKYHSPNLKINIIRTIIFNYIKKLEIN